MSEKHPIIVVTGSSGAGAEPVMSAFTHLFWREKVKPVVVQGDGFHRYSREEMKAAVEQAGKCGNTLTHFGPEGNLLDKLEATFREYGESGTGEHRQYLHCEADAAKCHQACGTFTPWERLPEDSDLLFYQGLHGGFVSPEIDIARHVDLLVGVTPIVNLEWIQKINRDADERGYSREAIMHSIMERMPDYVNHITPQFSRTHINFQRVPVVDTSNPFIARDVPNLDESFMVIRFRSPKGVDFAYLQRMIKDSFMSRPNTLVLPAGKAMLAMEIIFLPLLHELTKRKRG
ncbi:MAG: phosphoribulokinase [Sulfurimicrobium sp.]|nr:phosphoribulokinase [Sulfurimicrobium sp.]